MIQVAAVAVAIIEDLSYGRADTNKWSIPVLHEVKAERERQDQKWGPQHHDPQGWMLILMEEIGEAAEETHPWATSRDRDTLKQVLVRDMVILGNKTQQLLDENEGMPE